MNLLRGGIASLVVSFAVACGGSVGSAPMDAAAGTDGASGEDAATSDGGCLTSEPTQGSACVNGQSVCSSGDPCCIGYVWTCAASTNTWQKEGLGCACRPPDADAGVDAARGDAGPVVCGIQTCSANEYCTQSSGGAPLPDGGGTGTNFVCTPLPAACGSTPTCLCVQTALNGCSCTDVDGSPVVTCNYP